MQRTRQKPIKITSLAGQGTFGKKRIDNEFQHFLNHKLPQFDHRPKSLLKIVEL